jgi:hypothetical protein
VNKVMTPAPITVRKTVPQIGRPEQVMAGLFDKLATQTAWK